MMQIFVKSCLPSEGTVTIDVLPQQTVYDLKLLINERLGSDGLENQHLVYGLSPLSDEYTLEECNITSEATVYQYIDLCGGAKKKKKKTFLKPKKGKHKKKKVKLAVLQYYTVEDDGVKHLRKECPANSCGAGVFMALHHNRSHCGRCGLTTFNKSDE